MSFLFLAELPGVWLDPLAVEASVSSRIQVVNRNPEPGETSVPPLTAIDILILDTGTGSPGIALAATRVYVDGVLAYDGSSGSPFQAGYDGVTSAVTASGANGYRVLLEKVGATFPSLAVIPVRVVSATTDALSTIDTSWEFTVVDTTAPTILVAQPITPLTLLVRFNKPVRQEGDGAPEDALTPANYTFATSTVPAVTPEVVSVTTVSPSEVLLTFRLAMTQHAIYTVFIEDLEDLLGNAAAIPSNSAMFTGFTYAIPSGRKFDLYRMLPLMNRRQDSAGTKELERFIRCLQEIVDVSLVSIDQWTDILDPDVASEGFVDAMLLGLGNPFKFELSLEDKRRLVSVLVPIYKQKGTAVGIINVVRFFLGLEVTIDTYSSHGLTLGISELGSDGTDGDWELGPDGVFSAFAFNVIVGQILTDVQRTQLKALVNYMKSAPTHFVELIEPEIPLVIDHLELGLSDIGVNWDLH